MPANGGSEKEGAIFSGMCFFLFGFDPVSESQYRSEISLRGGVNVGMYDKSRCTHVVVSGRVYDDPFCVVAREDRMTLVTESWIEDCVDFGTIADAGSILYKPLKDLNGIPGCGTMYICLTGYQRQERDDIMRMVEMMGANFSKPLIANKITHLICYKFEGEKYELAKRVNIKLINHRWLEDCLKAWKILPVDKYAKSGYEMEILEAQANDSEEETQDQGARFSIQKDNITDATPQKSMRRVGESDFSTKGLKTYTREKNPEVILKSSCNENILLSNRSLLTTSSKDSKGGNFILPNPDEVIDLEKEGDEELLDMRNIERKASTLGSLRKTPVKPEETSGHLFGSLKRNMFGIEDSAFTDFDTISSAAKENNTHHSIINQTASTETHLQQSDSLARKRESSYPGIGTRSPDLHQSSKPDGQCWSMSNKSTQFRDTVLNRSTAANEDAINYCMVNHSTPLIETGSRNVTSDLNLRSSKSKAKTCRSTNVGVLPINKLVHAPEKSARVVDLDWTTSSSANLSASVHKASDYTVSPACEKNKILADDLKTHMNNAVSDKDALARNDREVFEPSPLERESGTFSVKSNKSQIARLSGCLDISKKDSINLPVEVNGQHQKQHEKSSPPESTKSDITRLQNGSSTEIMNSKIENIETSSKKFLKKKLCSKLRPSRRKHTEDVTSVSLNKSIIGNEGSFMSRDVEHEKEDSGGQNLVIDSKSVVEDKLNVPPLISSSCVNDKVTVDVAVKSKDLGRQNPTVEIKGLTVKLDEYCSKSVGKGSGKSKQRTNNRLTNDNEAAVCLDKNPTGYKESFMSMNMQHEMAIIDEQNLVTKSKNVAEDNSNITPFVSNKCKNIEVRSDMDGALKDPDKQKQALEMKGSTVKSGKLYSKSVGKDTGKSMQRPNKRLAINETAVFLNKKLTGSRELFVSENMEDEMAVIRDQSCVKKSEIVVEDNNNITTHVSNKCKNLEVRTDKDGASKDSDKQKSTFEMNRSTAKSDKYVSEKEVKVGGNTKQKANKRQRTKIETAVCLDRNPTLNEESFVSENMEHEVEAIDEHNLVIKPKHLVEDNSNITPSSYRCKKIEVRSDMADAIKDPNKQKSAFEIKGSTLKSDKYGSKREVKVSGKSKQKASKRKHIETAACLDENPTSNGTFMSENMEDEITVIDKQNLAIKPNNVAEDNSNITPLISNRCKNIEVRSSDMCAAIKDPNKQKQALEVNGSIVRSGKYCSKKVVKDNGKCKQRANKRLSINNETADIFDKNLTGSKESFVSENMEDEDIDEQNLVNKPEIAIDDGNNMGGTPKDSDKEKSTFEKKGSTVKSDKYDSKREVNGSEKSKQKANKRQRTEIETAAFLNKNPTGNEESFMSEKIENEMAVSDEKNFVTKQNIVVEDNSYITTPLGSNRCKNLEVRDINCTIKDSEKQISEFEKKCSTVKLNKYGSNMEVKVGGKSMHIVEKVGSDVGNQGKALLKKTVEPVWFIFCGHHWQRKHFKQVIKRLKGRMCPDSHIWYHKATHFIVPEPVRRTEKFVAASAAGRWILKTDYLSASNEAGKFLSEEPFEWFDNVLTEDANIDLKAPRKWRHLKERTGHGALYGLRIVIYGECIAPSLDTIKRFVMAGNGTILATSPPYTRFLNSEIDLAIISSGIPRVDLWVQEFMRHEIPCVLADYLVDYICKPGHSLDRHVLFNTHEWAAKSFEKITIRSGEIISCDSSDEMMSEDENDIRCVVCERHDRGEVMLICGDEEGSFGCGIGTHIDCCVPPFESVPKEDWFCQKCSERKSTTLSKVKKRRKKLTKKCSSGNSHQSPCNKL